MAHLEERAAGHGSLWEYCLRALHLREGPAGRRIAAMRVVRRFPALEPALRDGRLCLSTVTLVAPLLKEENLDEVVARAAFKTKAEVEHLVASMQPRAAPKEGVRKLAERAKAGEANANDLGSAPPAGLPFERPAQDLDAPFALAANDLSLALTPAPPATSAPRTVVVPAPISTPPIAPAPRPRAELRPVSGEEWSLRVTLDASMKADLDTLKALLGHTAGGDLAAVVREALRCAVEKHGKRRGAVRPARSRFRAPTPAAIPGSEGDTARAANLEEVARASAPARHIPAAVRRAVWERDGGRCAWTSSDGRRCGSTWKLELDHVVPVARGGPSTIANLRLTCRAHNLFHAEQLFGREHMARFVRHRAAAAAQGLLIPG